MLLKLKQESSSYPSWIQSVADKLKYVEDYRRLGVALDKASVKNCRSEDFGETKINLDVRKMGSKAEQDPENACGLSESYSCF